MRYKDETNRGQCRGSPLCGGGILTALIVGDPCAEFIGPETMKPVSVQVITYAPTVFYHCQHCELAFKEMGIGERLRRHEAAEALPDDLSREYQVVSDWVHRLAASIRGVLSSLRHRVGRYPAVIVDGQEKRVGLDFAALDPLIDRRVAAAREAGATPH